MYDATQAFVVGIRYLLEGHHDEGAVSAQGEHIVSDGVHRRLVDAALAAVVRDDGDGGADGCGGGGRPRGPQHGDAAHAARQQPDVRPVAHAEAQ